MSEKVIGRTVMKIVPNEEICKSIAIDLLKEDPDGADEIIELYRQDISDNCEEVAI